MPAAAAKKPTKPEKAKAKPRAKDKSSAKATEPAKAAGDRDTQHLQERLKQLGYGVTVDGQRGQRTTNALKLFQRDHGLKPDGEIGPRTKAAMRGSSKEAIDEIRKGSKAKSDTSNATAGEPSAATSTATGTPRKRVEVRTGEHRVVVYEEAVQLGGEHHLAEALVAWDPGKHPRAHGRFTGVLRGLQPGDGVRVRGGHIVGRNPAGGYRVFIHDGIGIHRDAEGYPNAPGMGDMFRTHDVATPEEAARMALPPEGRSTTAMLRESSGRVLAYGGDERPPRWVHPVEEAEPVSEAKVDPADCSMDHAKLGKKGLPQCPKCSSKLGEKTEEQALLESLVSGPAWLLVEGVESQTRLRQLTLSALDAEQAWMDSLVESQLLESVFLAGLDESAKTAALSSTPSPFSTSKTSNWVARAGGLPDYIQNIAKALVRGGKSVSTAIATSIAAVKRWAAGRGGVHPEVRAAAAKAVAEWEKKRAQTHAASAAKAA